MLRPATLSAALLAMTALVAVTRAQAPRTQSIIYARLEDPAGNPVAGATGWLRQEPPRELRALPAATARIGEGLAAPWPTATSDDRGLLRFGGAEWQPGAGSGLVTTPQGLGAVLPRMFARRLQQVTLEPMAEVTTPSGSEPFTLYARARLADGSRVVLPRQRGASVRLPAGDYEVWAQSEDGWAWRRLALRAGSRTPISFEGSAQRLRVPADAYLHPSGWPGVPLHRAGDPGEVLLRGEAISAPLVTWTGNRVTPAAVIPPPTTVAARPWPPGDPGGANTFDGGLADAEWYGLLQRANGSFRLVARSHAGADRVVTLPDRPDGDAWLLATGDFAPLALPWPAAGRQAAAVVATRGVAMAVRARTRQQLPVADLICTYTPLGMAAATIVARTDATGSATFGLCRAPGTLRVEDPRYANQQLELEEIPSRPLTLTADRGARCSGAAAFADGASAGTILVTLRDPTGELRPANRAQALAPGERFVFEGLPAGRDVVLFATAHRAGKTWSARRVARSGDEVALTLKDEDPQLGR